MEARASSGSVAGRIGRASVVIPAHNEGAVIGRCLRALAAPDREIGFETIVVCNGCTDDTADVARRQPGVRVVELSEPSKIAALNAGDSLASYFPRIYLDADIELGFADAARTVELLREGQVHCAAPRPAFQLSGRPYVVRAFYRIWSRLPFLQDEPIGNGVYALSEAGRARFDRFPDVTADDLFVRNLFRRDERRCVEDAEFIVRTPRQVRGLFAMRVRAYRGALELSGRRPSLDPQRGHPGRGLVRLLTRPRTTTEAAVYLALNLVAKTVAVWRDARGVTGWERDESARNGDGAA